MIPTPQPQTMRKYESLTDTTIYHEGKRWDVTVKAFYRADGTGELRFYSTRGDVTDPKMMEAFQAEADLCGLSAVLQR